MIKRLGLKTTLSLLVSTAAATTALAAEPLVIPADQAQVMRIDRPAAIVVVGNPSIAEASVQDKFLFLHGRNFGTTNVVLIDNNGNQIADYEVTVQQGGSNNLAMFKAGAMYSYACAPDCEVQLHVGDDPGYFNQMVLGPSSAKIGLATGQKLPEAPSSSEPSQ